MRSYCIMTHYILYLIKVLDFYTLYLSGCYEDGESKHVAEVIAKLFYQ
jgi:hypothetical protein